MLSRVLIERHPIAKTASLGMRCSGEETLLGGVRPRDSRQTHTGEDRQPIPVRCETLQVRAEHVIPASLLGKEELRQDPHVRLNRPIRRGVAVVSAPNAGRMASSSGSARQTPVPRKKARRFNVLAIV